MLGKSKSSWAAFARSFAKLSPAIDLTTNSLKLDRAKCISCGLCVKACKTIAGQGVLALTKGPDGKKISTATGLALQETKCIKCGQCTLACGPAAIAEKDQVQDLEAVLQNRDGRTLVVMTAPAIRINLCDGFGLPAGSIGTGKMVTVLKRLGFNYVFDTNFAADLCIVEEATELVSRITKGTGPLPMFTSCCPAWVNYVEQSDPSLIPHLSTCRSPLGMHSSIIKSDWARLKGLTAQQIYNVAIMPCTAKKDEIAREQLRSRGYPETDLVLTTRELIRLIKKKKINFKALPDTDFDPCYSIGSGAGAIFCGSGGVMEAAVRTAYTLLTKKSLKSLDFPSLRGAKDGVKITTVDFDGTKVGVAVAQGIANAQKLIAKIKGKDPSVANVAFVEIMGCPGGCVCGGGSPKAKTKKAIDARVDAVYKIDSGSAVRTSHENPEVKEFYARFGGKPNGHVAHEYLHTHFQAHSKK
jgi:NADH-quinone oxidoreductase subunit G